MDTSSTSFKGFSGVIDRIQLMDLVQFSCLSQMSRTFQVQSEAVDGFIHIRSGQVVHASVGDARGEEALYAMLGWRSGRFASLPLMDDIAPTIGRTWEYLIVEALRAKSLRPAATQDEGFSGTLEYVQLSDLVQLACMAGKDHLIDVRSEAGEGRLYVRAGQVRHAQWGELGGEAAFNAILAWEGGSFEGRAPGEEVPDTIDRPWEYLMIEAMRYRDEIAGKVGDEPDTSALSLAQRVQLMKMTEKIKLAMSGDKETRTLLIRDPNRMIQFAIVNNPRITEGEIISICHSRNIDEDVLRKIASSREWTKLYQVRIALATNPKTSLPIATRLVRTLNQQDLKLIAKSKSVPTAVAQAARRLIMVS